METKGKYETGKEEYTSVTLRVPVSLVERIDMSARNAYISRSAAIRQMLAWALSQAQDSPAINSTAS